MDNLKKKDNLTDIVEEFDKKDEEQNEDQKLNENEVLSSTGEVITLGEENNDDKKMDNLLDKAIEKLEKIFKK